MTPEVAQGLLYAAKVIALDGKISGWLLKHDPMALKQIVSAIRAAESVSARKFRCWFCSYVETVKAPAGARNIWGSGVDFCYKCDRPRRYLGELCEDEIELDPEEVQA